MIAVICVVNIRIEAAKQVTANIDVKYFGGSVSAPVKISAILFVDGGSWYMETKYGDEYTEKIVHVDGEIYTQTQFKKDKKQQGGEEKKALQLVQITEGPVPIFCETTSKIMWILFCQEALIDYYPNLVPAIWRTYDSSIWVSSFVCNAVKINDKGITEYYDYTVIEELTEEAVFNNPYVKSFDEMPSLETVINTLPKVNKDHSIISIKTEDSSGGGVVVEVKITYDESQRYLGKYVLLANIEKEVEKIILPPKLTEDVFVNDYRFKSKEEHVDSISYVITDKEWKSRDDPNLVALYKSKKERELRHLENKEVRKMPIWIIIPLLGIIYFGVKTLNQIITQKNNK